MLQRGTILIVGASILILGVIGGVVVYGSTQPTKIERTIACVKKLGYSTSVSYDDGREPFDYPEGTIVLDDGTWQARPPSYQVTALLPGGVVATVTVPDDGGTSRTAFSHGVPHTAGQRAAVSACANA